LDAYLHQRKKLATKLFGDLQRITRRVQGLRILWSRRRCRGNSTWPSQIDPVASDLRRCGPDNSRDELTHWQASQLGYLTKLYIIG